MSSEYRKNKKAQTFVLDVRRKVYVPAKRTDSSKWVSLALIAVVLIAAALVLLRVAVDFLP